MLSAISGCSLSLNMPESSREKGAVAAKEIQTQDLIAGGPVWPKNGTRLGISSLEDHTASWITWEWAA